MKEILELHKKSEPGARTFAAAGPALSVLIVTGRSGAGVGTALNILQDLSFDVTDNPPLELIPQLIEIARRDQVTRVAIGVDIRSRGYSEAALSGLVAALHRIENIEPRVLFLECDPRVLMQRFEETRRRHPLAQAGSVEEGIKAEGKTFQGVRAVSDFVIDTTDFSPHDLRLEIADRFTLGANAGLRLSVESFSYKRGVPRIADLVFDCRFLHNPHWSPELRPLTGCDAKVQDYIFRDERSRFFLNHVLELLNMLIPGYQERGKSYLTICFGCTGGRHRSVFAAEQIAARLRKSGHSPRLLHRALRDQGLWPKEPDAPGNPPVPHPIVKPV